MHVVRRSYYAKELEQKKGYYDILGMEAHLTRFFFGRGKEKVLV